MKLGELFVDLGVNSGSAFNTLTGFAFKFNQLFELTKNVGTALDNAFGKTLGYANKLNKLNQVTSVSRNTLQAMNLVAKKSGTSIESLAGELSKLDEEFLRFRRGDTSLLKKVSPLGITSEDILKSTSSLELMEKIVKRIQQIPDSRARYGFLGGYGQSIENYNAWTDLFQNIEKYKKNGLALTDEEINSLDRLYKLNIEIGQKNEQRAEKFKAQNAPLFEAVIKYIQDIKDGFFDAIDGADSFGEAVGKACDYSIKKLNDVWTEIANSVDSSGGLAKLGTFIGRFIKGTISAVIDGIRAVTSFGVILDKISNLDFKGAKEVAKNFYEESWLKKDFENWFGDEIDNKKKIKTPEKRVKPVRSSQETERRQNIVAEEFRKAGYDEKSARAFVGNFTYESGGDLNPFENTGDKGKAFGIAQWQRGGRADNLLKQMRGVTDVDEALRIQSRYAIAEILNNKAFKGLRPENFNKLPYEQKVDKIINEYEMPAQKYRRGGEKSSYEARRDIGLGFSFNTLESSIPSGGNNYTITNEMNVYSTPEKLVADVSLTGNKAMSTIGKYIEQANSSS